MLAGEMYSEATARPRFTGSPFKIRRPSRTASWPTRVGNVTAPPRLCFATHFSHPLYSSPGDMTTSFRRPASSKASATPIDIWPAGENTPSIRGWRWSRFSVICLALARFQSPYSALSSSICENRSEEHTSELQSRLHLVCRLLLEKKKVEHRVTSGRVEHHTGAGVGFVRRNVP